MARESDPETGRAESAGERATGGSSLAGKRVVLLRAAHQAAATADALRDLGAVPLQLPLVELHPPPDPAQLLQAARQLDRYDLVAVTSENAVARLVEALERVGAGVGALRQARLAAIGRSTEQALRAHGLVAQVLPARFVGEDFARAILEDLARVGGARGKRVLLPRALVAREILPETLRAAGVEVDVVPAYESRRAGPERLRQLRQIVLRAEADVILLSASSLAEGLAEALGPEVGRVPSSVLVASIGDITTATAERLGLRVDLTAEPSTMAALLDAVERRFTELR